LTSKEPETNLESNTEPQSGDPDPTRKPIGRSKLVYRVLLFQLKLVADGLRDLLLVPVSLTTGVLGLIAGGNDPERFFRELLRFGRRSDRFINLFDQRNNDYNEEQWIPTSDELLEPYQEKFLDHASRSPLVQKVDEKLDGINSSNGQ